MPALIRARSTSVLPATIQKAEVSVAVMTIVNRRSCAELPGVERHGGLRSRIREAGTRPADEEIALGAQFHDSLRNRLPLRLSFQRPHDEAVDLLHHVMDGRLARPEDGTYFCSGCNLQTLYVLGYRRALAGEPF